MKAKRAAANALVGRLGNQRVARSGADPFSESVGQPQHERLPRRGDASDQRPGDSRQRVTGNRQRAATTRAIGPRSSPELENAGERLGRPFKDSQKLLAPSRQFAKELR